MIVFALFASVLVAFPLASNGQRLASGPCPALPTMADFDKSQVNFLQNEFFSC